MPFYFLCSPRPSPPSRRGFIMGIWNSHTSVGNILGTLIAGVWVSGPWGLSFVVPGIITAAMGIFTFLFLIECEWTPPLGPSRWERAAGSGRKCSVVGQGAGCVLGGTSSL